MTPIPSSPSTRARLVSHANDVTYDTSSSARHESDCASRAAYAIPSAPSTSAAIVPGPTRGSHTACSGGHDRMWMFQLNAAGSSQAMNMRPTATTTPAMAGVRTSPRQPGSSCRDDAESEAGAGAAPAVTRSGRA